MTFLAAANANAESEVWEVLFQLLALPTADQAELFLTKLSNNRPCHAEDKGIA